MIKDRFRLPLKTMKEDVMDMQSVPIEYTCPICGAIKWELRVVANKTCLDCQVLMSCEEEIDGL